ncbi:hypothetical protein JD844_028734 [Phrynosoma platyrhinos]|uniref:USP domain-containing protein n=1 Tax=Phrynosoma platyrhinos TaxID=52577 RepID=A0ABQ7SIE3_PHRPL|nr:hypothetical protein JD844_028734 [Phrynosoma platyrhinos]
MCRTVHLMGQGFARQKKTKTPKLDEYQTVAAETDEEEEEEEESREEVREKYNKKLKAICGMADSRNGAVGLYNIGLSCCLNSLLQVFFMNRYFTMILRRIKVPFEVAEQKASVPYQMLLLLEEMQRGKQKSVHPLDLAKCLSKHNVRLFVLYDAAQLLLILWNLIKDQITKPDLVSVLALQTKASRYEDSLRSFFAPEQLMEENAFRCERCDRKTPWLRGMKVTYLPQTLILHLKRFCCSERCRTQKINTFLSFPQSLDFSQILAPEQYCLDSQDKDDGLYDLFAVVAHSGSANFGHYCAYVWSLIEHKWYCFNDSSVCQVSKPDLQGEKPILDFPDICKKQDLRSKQNLHHTGHLSVDMGPLAPKPTIYPLLEILEI